MQLGALIASVVFLTALTLLGVWHAKHVKTGEDFALAGRRLPLGVLVGTLIATWIGTGSIFGNAEKAYEYGPVMFALPFAGAFGVLALSLLAGRVRALPAHSVPEVLRIRFGRTAQLVGALALIGAYLIIVSYQFRAGAAVVGYIVVGADGDTGLPQTGLEPPIVDSHTLGVMTFAVFVILYTVLAGMVSVAWTDFINGILMAVGILVAVAVLGFQAWRVTPDALPVVSQLREDAPPIPSATWLGMLLPTFLLVLGDANIYQRFMSAKSPALARWAAIYMFVGIVILESAIIGLAYLGRMLLPSEPTNHGYAIVEIAFTLLPPWLGVILVMSILAIIVTTADSFLLAASTSVSADIHSGLTTAHQQRMVVVLLGLVALGLSFTSDEFFSVAIYAYTLYGVTLTPAIVLALVAPSTPAMAVVVGMIAGLSTAIGWKLLEFMNVLKSNWAEIDPVLPALGMNLLTTSIIWLVVQSTRRGSA